MTNVVANRRIMKIDVPEGHPALDEAMLQGPLGDVIRSLDGETEADPAGVLASLLAELGSLVGPRPFLELSRMRVTCQLFSLLVGPTAAGRKGTASRLARQVMDSADFGRPAGFLQHGFSSGEALIDTLALMKDRRVLVMQEEMMALLTAMNRDGSTLSPVVRALWDGGPLTHTTVMKQSVVEDAHVSMICHITAEELCAKLSWLDLENGLANRFLIFAVHRRYLVATDGVASSTDAERRAVERLRRHVLAAQDRGQVALSPSGFDRWWDIYTSGSLGGSSLSARRDPQLLRLALLHALLEGAPAVEPRHLDVALAIWQYVEESIRWIYPTPEALLDRVAARLLELIAASGENGLSMREISEAFSNHLDKKSRDAALALLLKHGQVERRKVATAGRPREVFSLAPSRSVGSE